MHLDSSLNLLWLCDSFRLTEAARLAGRPAGCPGVPATPLGLTPSPTRGRMCAQTPYLFPCLLNPPLPPVAPVTRLLPLGPHLTWSLGATAHCGHTLSARRAPCLASLWPAPSPLADSLSLPVPRPGPQGPAHLMREHRVLGSCTAKPRSSSPSKARPALRTLTREEA